MNQKYKAIIWVVIQCISTASSLILQCPHGNSAQLGLSRSSHLLQPVTLDNLQGFVVETTCSFPLVKLSYKSITQQALHWRRSGESITINSNKITVSSTCVLSQTDLESLMENKAIFCLDYSCNDTDICQPLLNVIVSQDLCRIAKNCLIIANGEKVPVQFQQTICPVGIFTGSQCFQPITSSTKKAMSPSYMTLPVACYSTPKSPSIFNIFLDSPFPDRKSDIRNSIGFPRCWENGIIHYVCIVGQTSSAVILSRKDEPVVWAILNSMNASRLGFPLTSLTLPPKLFVVTGKGEYNFTEGDSPVLLTENFTSFSGSSGFTSLMRLSNLPITLELEDSIYTTRGLVVNGPIEHCAPHSLPSVWFNYVTIPGYFYPLTRCTIFCVLSGPGASCDAFSVDGIIQLNSSQCTIPSVHRFRSDKDTISFTCNRLDTDLEFYCNGYKKTLTIQTLITGQCIYTLTSIFSIIDFAARPLAVEICVPGMHGWCTLFLLITFCFGWVLIPVIVRLVMQILILASHICVIPTTKTSIHKLLVRMREEFQKTVGNTTCEVCLRETASKEEMASHKESCHLGLCPYCYVEIGVSQTLLDNHYNFCLSTGRFLSKMKKLIDNSPTLNSLFRRKVKVFRYKNRCFIMSVWTILLTIELMLWGATAQILKNDLTHGVGKIDHSTDFEIDMSIPATGDYTYQRELVLPGVDKTAPFTFKLEAMVTKLSIQELGHWNDADVAIMNEFHCYGSCESWGIKWPHPECTHQHFFNYESSWDCNPPTCPSNAAGCFACALYLTNITTKGPAARVLQITHGHKYCIQYMSQKKCGDLTDDDCVVLGQVKLCLIGVVTSIIPSDVLYFPYGYDESVVIMKQWCDVECTLGSPGDFMTNNNGLQCPEFSSGFIKKCWFATTPHCQYLGNIVSGYKRYDSTRDSFRTINITDVKHTPGTISWKEITTTSRIHVNLQINKVEGQEDLTDISCGVSIKTTTISGSWGSGNGFTLGCEVSLIECSQFMTAIKACDSSKCYGSNTVHLDRGVNQVTVTGRGGHSGSRFRCCHNSNCSSTALLASLPHLDRIESYDSTIPQYHDDGSESCGIQCFFSRVWEWLTGIFSNSWWIVVLLIGLVLLSLLLLKCFFPSRSK